MTGLQDFASDHQLHAKTSPKGGVFFCVINRLQQGYREQNFRPKCRKRGSGTEVSKGAGQETSVQNAENVARVRKSESGFILGRQRVRTYWEIGKYIVEYEREEIFYVRKTLENG